MLRRSLKSQNEGLTQLSSLSIELPEWAYKAEGNQFHACNLKTIINKQTSNTSGSVQFKQAMKRTSFYEFIFLCCETLGTKYKKPAAEAVQLYLFVR